MTELTVLLKYLIFPGLLFTAVAGLVTSWVDRKVTARVQMRVGPPFFQPFFDIGKLMSAPDGRARVSIFSISQQPWLRRPLLRSSRQTFPSVKSRANSSVRSLFDGAILFFGS